MLFLISYDTVISNLQSRTKQEVCAMYKLYYEFPQRHTCSVPETSSCEDDGGRKDYDIIKTVDRVNYFRMLSGLTPLNHSRNPQINREQKLGAIMMGKNKKMSHGGWTSDDKCYSQDAANGPSKSNIAYSSSIGYCAADTIVSYMDDQGTSSLGHRRWILDPHLLEVSAGVYRGYSDLRTIFSNHLTTFKKPEILAYPPPGYFPALPDCYYGKIPIYWSMSRNPNDHNMPNDATAQISCDGTTTLSSFNIMSENSAMYPGAIIMQLNQRPAMNERCEVTITSDSVNKQWKYFVQMIDCSNYVLTSQDNSSKIYTDYALDLFFPGSGGSGGRITTTATSNKNNNQNSKNNLPMIIGIVVGVLVAVAVIIVIIIFVKRRSYAQDDEDKDVVNF